MSNPAAKPTDEALAFYKRVGEALTTLHESPAWHIIEQAELDNMEDLKTRAAMLSTNEPYYERKLTYMNGMAEGLRRWRETKRIYVNKYREYFNKQGGK